MKPGTVTVVNHRHKGKVVFIGRPSVFGNPFPIQRGRDRCIAEYEEYFNQIIDKGGDLSQAVEALVGRVRNGEDIYLQCFCAPLRCHGDVIKKYIESRLEVLK